MTDNRSFGFSPNSTINQNIADYFDLNDRFRLSWHLNGNNGGYRLGDKYNLDWDRSFKKYAFVRT